MYQETDFWALLGNLESTISYCFCSSGGGGGGGGDGGGGGVIRKSSGRIPEILI